MARRLCLATLILLNLFLPALSHGTITRPAMRLNTKEGGGWCQWCQGTQQFCNMNANSKSCIPTMPCWEGNSPGSRVSQSRFGGEMSKLRTPDGSYWVDEDVSPLIWHPGQTVLIHFMIFADHNGVYRWESQLANPGAETEVAFRNFTPWRSFNNDRATTYYDEDGATLLEQGLCKDGSPQKNWSWHVEACRQHSWGKTSITLPKDMPLGRTVIRWLWYGGMTTDGVRVRGPEPAVFVNCLDVCIGAEENCGRQHKTAALSEVEAPTPSYVQAPRTVPASSLGSATAVSHADRMPVPAPAPSEKIQCWCAASTDWNGDFGQFVDGHTFCQQTFGSGGAYISGGGGDGSGGGASGPEPCTSKQYLFSREEGWKISVSSGQGQGKTPYRAFAYAQFCNGKPYRECWGAKQHVSFSFSFKTQGLEEIGTYVKMLFWTDSGNILGLLPPRHPKGHGQYRLLTFVKDDYPNSWSKAAPIQDKVWHHIRADFFPSSGAVHIFLNGIKLDGGTIPVDMLSARDGPQIGVYSFDYGQQPWPNDGFTLSLNSACIGKASGSCFSKSAGSHALGKAAVTSRESRQAVSPEPMPQPLPAQHRLTGAAHGLKPLSVTQQCSQTWDQCGGKMWKGATCCTAGNYCARLNNDMYHQCRPLDLSAAPEANGYRATPASLNAATAPSTMRDFFVQDVRLPVHGLSGGFLCATSLAMAGLAAIALLRRRMHRLVEPRFASLSDSPVSNRWEFGPTAQ